MSGMTDPVTREINARIADGIIPPEPPSIDMVEWRRWYDANVRCVTKSHAYFLRTRATQTCSECNEAGIVVPLVITHQHIELSPEAALMMKTAGGAAVKHEISFVTKPTRKPRSMP